MPKVGSQGNLAPAIVSSNGDGDATHSDLRIIHGDCLQSLPTLAEGCADLIYADPPFNIGLKYDGYEDNLPRGKYLQFTEKWLKEVYRVLSPTGTVFVQISPEMSGAVQCYLEDVGLFWRNTIIWHYRFGPNQRRKFSPCHQHLLYFTKHKSAFTFNADSVRVKSDRQKKYNDARANPLGKVPSDVWHYPRVCGTFKARADWACQTPDALLDRVIQCCSDKGDLVVDPFMGSGSVALACQRHKSRYVGVDVSEQAIAVTRERLLKQSVHMTNR